MFRWVILAFLAVIVISSHVGFLSFLHIPSCQLTWAGCHYPFITFFSTRSIGVQLVSIILTIVGLITAIVARRTISDNWSGHIEIKKDHKLITTGVYSYVRHPIYTGLFLMSLGTLILSQTILAIIFFLAIVGVFTFKLTQEEKLLMKHFPKEYPAYKKRTKALIPFII